MGWDGWILLNIHKRLIIVSFWIQLFDTFEWKCEKQCFFPSDLYLATIQRLLKRKEDGCIWCGWGSVRRDFQAYDCNWLPRLPQTSAVGHPRSELPNLWRPKNGCCFLWQKSKAILFSENERMLPENQCSWKMFFKWTPLHLMISIIMYSPTEINPF